MRRAAMAVFIVGLIFAEMVSGPGRQPVAVAASLATAAHSVKASKPDKKTVKFDGYAVSVPASWPVYDLTKDPRRCVRFDVHAVYLGTPGPDQDQDCPANLVGRVDTISISSAPKAPEAPARPRGPEGRGGAEGRPGRAEDVGGPEGPGPDRSADAPPGTILEDPGLHELALAMPGASPRIGATYGTDPGSTRQILATVRPDGVPGPRSGGDSISVTRHPVIVEEPAAPNKVKDINPAWPIINTPPTGVPPGWLPPSDPPAPAPPAPARSRPARCWPITPRRRRLRAGPWSASTPARPRRCRP